MKKWQWRQVMELDKVNYNISWESFRRKMTEILCDSGLIKKNSEFVVGDAFWYTDQKLISMQIEKHVNDLKSFELHPIQAQLRLIYTRIDRSFDDKKWMLFLQWFNFLTDCHSFRHLYNKWHLAQPLFEKMFGNKIKSWLDKYLFEYESVRKQEQ